MNCACSCHRDYQRVVYVIGEFREPEFVTAALANSLRCTRCGHAPGDGTTHYVVDNEVAP